MKKHITALTIPILSLLLLTTNLNLTTSTNLVASPLPMSPTKDDPLTSDSPSPLDDPLTSESTNSPQDNKLPSDNQQSNQLPSESTTSPQNQPASADTNKTSANPNKTPANTNSSTIKAINCRDFIADTEIFTNTERSSQIECRQFSPTENLITGTTEPPEVIQSLDMYIYNFSKSYNVDVDIVKAIVCTSFTDYGDTVQTTATNLGEFLQINVPILERNLQRYNGDYLLAIESMYRGVADIDILYATFGNEWDKHIRDIEYLTGACYIEQKEKLITTPYYVEVMKYYRRYKDEH